MTLLLLSSPWTDDALDVAKDDQALGTFFADEPRIDGRLSAGLVKGDLIGTVDAATKRLGLNVVAEVHRRHLALIVDDGPFRREWGHARKACIGLQQTPQFALRRGGGTGRGGSCRCITHRCPPSMHRNSIGSSKPRRLLEHRVDDLDPVGVDVVGRKRGGF